MSTWLRVRLLGVVQKEFGLGTMLFQRMRVFQKMTRLPREKARVFDKGGVTLSGFVQER
jgi:hypothetical protein